MAQRSIDACVLVDPVSIRYACGARNMQVFHLRNPARSLVVPVEGPVVLFEFTGCMHLAEGLETVDEIRPSVTPPACSRSTFHASCAGVAARTPFGTVTRSSAFVKSGSQPHAAPRAVATRCLIESAATVRDNRQSAARQTSR
jgi:hypothetical protein